MQPDVYLFGQILGTHSFLLRDGFLQPAAAGLRNAHGESLYFARMKCRLRGDHAGPKV